MLRISPVARTILEGRVNLTDKSMNHQSNKSKCFLSSRIHWKIIPCTLISLWTEQKLLFLSVSKSFYPYVIACKKTFGESALLHLSASLHVLGWMAPYTPAQQNIYINRGCFMVHMHHILRNTCTPLVICIL